MKPRTSTALRAAAVVLAGFALGACSPLGVAVGAGATAGVGAAQERGLSTAIDDTKIRLTINDLWIQESTDLFIEVNLQVQEGRVLLTGNVPDPETRLAAVRLSWQADGVREVINEIEIEDKSSFVDYARDVRINNELSARLLFDRQISSINYSLETVNQTVYLMGVAQDQTELDRVIAHAKDVSSVRRIVNYVRLKDDPARGS